MKMPVIGEVAMGGQASRPRAYIGCECPNCKNVRWVRRDAMATTSRRCRRCVAKVVAKRSGYCNPNKGKYRERSSQWKGGIKFQKGSGYNLVRLSPTDFFYPMVNSSGYVFEHRLVVAKILNRCLLPWEVVHHRVGYAKNDNRYPETLQLISDNHYHLVDSRIKGHIKWLERKVERLEMELAKCHQDVTLNVDPKDKGVHR